eukprot:5478042-Alexandrium_andersonii.AAC.1
MPEDDGGPRVQPKGARWWCNRCGIDNQMMRWVCRPCHVKPDWPNLWYQGLDKWYNRPQLERSPDKQPRGRKAKRGWEGDSEESQDREQEQRHG